jgi:hypothetical protein
MIIADAINLPLVAAFGLATFGPLTLLVSAIEAFVFRAFARSTFRAVFKRVLVANILSTLAGGVLLMLQDFIVYGSGIQESIPAFVRGYRWLGPVLIAGYFLKSVLVEGIWLTRRRFLDGITCRAGTALRAVLVGNVLSYAVVGPLFYVTTRPYFGGFETTFDAGWTNNPDAVVYYIDNKTKFVERMRMDGSDRRTLVPFPAHSFLVSADESTCAFVGASGSLFAYRAGEAEPLLIRDSHRGYFMTGVSLSPDNRRLALREPPGGQYWDRKEGDQDTIGVYDLQTGQAETVGKVPAKDWGHAIAWSADGKRLYAQVIEYRNEQKADKWEESETRWVYVLGAEPPYGLTERLTSPPEAGELVENYLRVQGCEAFVNGRPTIQLPRRCRAGAYEIEVYPYLGSGVKVVRAGQQLFMLQNAYGLLNLSMPPVSDGAFLPSGDEVLLDWWGQLYLLGLEHKRLALAAQGEHFVLRTPEFRVTFSSADE